MLAWFVLGISIFLGVVLAGRWFATADPKTLIKVLGRLGLGLLVLTIVFLAVTGRLAFAVPLLVGAFWWFVRSSLKNFLFQGAQKAFRSASGGTSSGGAGQSDIRTDYLRMNLDHGSGEIFGEVLRGHFKGAQLSSLSTVEVIELLQECQPTDQKSAKLLETYLDKTAGPDWRDEWAESNAGSNGNTGGAPNGPMTREEALEVLGLSGRPNDNEITSAHRKLMQKMHPDLGGSTWLATKINQARDLLLNA
ncbi:MAG: molecular chaperone DnaJ [Alphaproteobacteria bacterium]|jgi:hypothetical protein|nr:molecular chaperone DnaJ [Alphaproteobacteria bacterium]MBT4082309.1 molecular chaperone DnaJ [Alphaproteobacteria bacterium]MBT4542790.1 molecular chaperone DnaJ [Alphaproteobacteria bacterium]MBT7746906.1 molecular chaperone DnaJ [Alphaproteobacteria bacterium]